MGHWRSGNEELLLSLAEHESRMRREYAASLELIAELAKRNVVAEVGYRTLPQLLRDVLRISTREATRRVSHAGAVTAMPVVSGGTVPAAFPVVAAAVRDGAVGAEHVEVVVSVLRDLPSHVPETDREFAEQTLVDAARELDAGRLTKVGHQVRAWLDQDGAPPDDRELAEPVNELHLTTRANGRVALRGELSREDSAVLLTVVSALATPRPSSETGPDPRSAAERQGDALAELVRLAADTGLLPSEAGEKPHITVTVPLAALRTELPSANVASPPADDHAVLGGVGHLDPESARRLACDAKIIPAVLGSRSEPLDLGRASYTVTTALRRALTLRDRGCAFPGCDRPHQWCHAHHIRHWADGGPTSPDNLVLLCAWHHRLVHHSDWECAVVHGRPEFRPPTFIDPARTPRHNIHHHHAIRHRIRARR